MRYDEKIAGYKALLAELESGLEPIDIRPNWFRPKVNDTAPDWTYDKLRNEFILGEGIYHCITKTYVGIVFLNSPEDNIIAESNLAQAVEWVKARISEGPPKPKLKWEEVRTILPTTLCRYECTVPFGLNCDHLLYIGIGVFVEGDSWVEIFLATNEDDFYMRPMRKVVSLKMDSVPDGGYPAPFLEAEEALRTLLTTALDALNNPQP